MIYGPPLRVWLSVSNSGCYTNFTTQLQQLLLLNGLAKHNLRTGVGSGLTIVRLCLHSSTLPFLNYKYKIRIDKEAWIERQIHACIYSLLIPERLEKLKPHRSKILTFKATLNRDANVSKKQSFAQKEDMVWKAQLLAPPWENLSTLAKSIHHFASRNRQSSI